MSVIDLIPHTLRYCTVSDGYEDERGDWHEGTETWSDPIDCHAVPAGVANERTYADGTTYKYSYTIGRIETKHKDFSIGEKIRLNVFGKEMEFQVKGFHRYQAQLKIWV